MALIRVNTVIAVLVCNCHVLYCFLGKSLHSDSAYGGRGSPVIANIPSGEGVGQEDIERNTLKHFMLLK